MADEDGSTNQNRMVAVITGASSGIGRATALKFASEGYDLVLAARRLEELEDVARQASDHGVETLSVAADTSDEDAVTDVRDQAVEAFGSIDVWVNDAAVYMAGKFQDLPVADMKRLMDVNFFGYIYGSRAALEQFREQGYGTLINVSSINAVAPAPYASVYSASKAAIRTLDEAIRMELALDGLGNRVHICTIMPAGVDTNLYQNAANYTGHELAALEPVYDPDEVADAILGMTHKPKRTKIVGGAGTAMAMTNSLLPSVYEKQMGKFTRSDLLDDDLVEDTPGNLYESLPDNRGIRGGWRESRMPADTFNKIVGVTAASVAGLIGLGVLFFKIRKRRS